MCLACRPWGSGGRGKGWNDMWQLDLPCLEGEEGELHPRPSFQQQVLDCKSALKPIASANPSIDYIGGETILLPSVIAPRTRNDQPIQPSPISTCPTTQLAPAEMATFPSPSCSNKSNRNDQPGPSLPSRSAAAWRSLQSSGLLNTGCEGRARMPPQSKYAP